MTRAPSWKTTGSRWHLNLYIYSSRIRGSEKSKSNFLLVVLSRWLPDFRCLLLRRIFGVLTYVSSLAPDLHFLLQTSAQLTNIEFTRKTPLLSPKETTWPKIPTITHGSHTGLPLAIRTLLGLVVAICLITHVRDTTFRGPT